MEDIIIAVLVTYIVYVVATQIMLRFPWFSRGNALPYDAIKFVNLLRQVRYEHVVLIHVIKSSVRYQCFLTHILHMLNLVNLLKCEENYHRINIIVRMNVAKMQ